MKSLRLMIIVFLVGCTRNVNWVKSKAHDRWAELGYTVVAYEGYQWSDLCGGEVWHTLKREDSPGIIYSGFLCKWGDELHVYNVKPVSGQQVNHSGEVK